jgi:hypothetical protein
MTSNLPLLDRFRDPGFWRRLNPALTVGVPEVLEPVDQPGARLRERRFVAGGVVPAATAAALRLAGDRLAAAKIPPVFLFAYDQPWQLCARAAPLVEQALAGRVALLPDLWAWRVEPPRAPERARPPRWLFAARPPTSLTLWFPLGDGSVEGWAHDLLRWSSRAPRPEPAHRTGFAFELQRADVAPHATPLLDPRAAPPLAGRLALIGRQILQRRGWHVVPERLADLAARLAAH